MSDLRFEQAFIEHGWDERHREIRWQTWQAAIKAERERCAKRLEAWRETVAMGGLTGTTELRRRLTVEADAIRRGEGV